MTTTCPMHARGVLAALAAPGGLRPAGAARLAAGGKAPATVVVAEGAGHGRH